MGLKFQSWLASLVWLVKKSWLQSIDGLYGRLETLGVLSLYCQENSSIIVSFYLSAQTALNSTDSQHVRLVDLNLMMTGLDYFDGFKLYNYIQALRLMVKTSNRWK